MSEAEKDLSARYRAAARDVPPPHVDAAILAAAKRAVGAQPKPAGAPGALRRWYVPVSLAAVIVLSVIVTLRVEHERPELALPDAVPLERQKDRVAAEKPAEQQPAAAPPERRVQSPPALRPAATPAPVFVPEPKAAQDAAPEEAKRDDRRREIASGAAAGATAENAAARSAAEAEAASASARHEARAMSAPAGPAIQASLAKQEQAPAEWLERIAELRKRGQDQQADEQLAEFRRRYPDYRIPDAMLERIAPRK